MCYNLYTAPRSQGGVASQGAVQGQREALAAGRTWRRRMRSFLTVRLPATLRLVRQASRASQASQASPVLPRLPRLPRASQTGPGLPYCTNGCLLEPGPAFALFHTRSGSRTVQIWSLLSLSREESDPVWDTRFTVGQNMALRAASGRERG